jgi:toxin ParE1/3/4
MLWLHEYAERDIADAFRYYKAEAGASIARGFLREVERVASLLEAEPGLGTPTNGSRRTYPLSVFPYSVIYRPVQGGIRVLVVRHHRRDPAFGAERG